MHLCSEMMQVDDGLLCPFYFLYNYPYNKLLIWASILLTHLCTHFRIGDVILRTVQCCNSLSLPKEKILVNYFSWQPATTCRIGCNLKKKRWVCLRTSEISFATWQVNIFFFSYKDLGAYYQCNAENIIAFQSLTLQDQKVPPDLLTGVPCYCRHCITQHL